MRVFRTWLVGLGAGVLLAAGLALAGDPAVDYPECTRTPSAADLEGAKGAHKAATQFYERADYARAIQYWKDAYQFDCTAHGVLINIANAYEKKGDRAEAVAALETYLTRTTDASETQTIQEKIQNLKNSLKTEPVPSASQSSSVKPPPLPTASASAGSSVEPPPAPEPPYGYAPWVVAGAGIVPLLAGGILLPSGLSAISDAEKKCPTRNDCGDEVADKGNSGRTQATVGGVLLGLGAAGIVGGLVWQFAFNNPVVPQAAPQAPAVRVLPAAGPGFAGVGVSGSF
jgi:hypothetical protein